jgi:carboxypeptidase Taq
MISRPASFDLLLQHLREIDDLRQSASLLYWDQATYMPDGGAPARGRQLSTLSKIAHEKFISPQIGDLLSALESYESESAPEGFEASLLRITKRDYLKALRVPSEFEARFSAHMAHSYETWTKAKPNNEWHSLEDVLKKTLDLSLEYSSFFHGEHPADSLIDDSDPGFTTKQIRELFTDLRRELVPLVNEVCQRPTADDSILHGYFPIEQQRQFARKCISSIGYDWDRGRMDDTHHPFMTKFSIGDVRITVRGSEDEATELLFGALHEAGHALYEQGIDPRFEGTPLAEGASSGIHESQSRLWENLVGRSEPFWNYFYPQFQKVFPQFKRVPKKQFLQAINKVQRSLIRTDSDELTYNLHIMIRFDLELELLEGKINMAELPDAWNARYESDLGLTPPDNARGCLQDVHWFSGTIGGAFQGYTLGNILSAQFFDAAQRKAGNIEADIGQGEFKGLKTWLNQNIYRFGRARDANSIVQLACDEPLNAQYYIKYLRNKFVTLA